MNNVKRRASARKVLKPMAKVLGVALALSATNAGAIGPVQETGPALWQHIWNQFNTLQSKVQEKAQFVKENTQWLRDWNQTIKEYNEMLVRVQGIVNDFGLPAATPLTPVPPKYLIAETCGTGAQLKDLMTSIVFKPDGDWKDQQTQICVNIRMMQNRKYNDAVDFMQKTGPSIMKSLDSIAQIRFGSSRLGDMEAVANDSLRTANEMNASVQNFEARIKAYDAYISVMEANQKVVAQAALKGDPMKNLASDLVKTVALKTALSID
ncbi:MULTISPECIES: hypothetical protein [Stenotrophomonas]|uniref:hypothetical protein n=1 Tax=Stenotrophomonas TaxID=40323 RepID=UPI0006BA4CA6|nr:MULTISPECIES: hypothetical protein [Stenotrophomonas]MBA0243960.1 hypothetical protein [Stenotrophomonas maltophilia]MBA0247189.1 hypothetical protein [Stenotrophomonas maltophilia]MBA0307609.1 hypothetical protein [Stenotrophomonas maltophilia]MBA0439812.1 hypothetical protein [Stenotrophomonas maltophilia]MBA0515592.1 hypothetical protein [Stenotrophomonas maltophilia]